MGKVVVFLLEIEWGAQDEPRAFSFSFIASFQMRLINNNSMAEETLRKVEISCAPYQVNEDDVFEFVAPDAAPSIIESLSKAGHVSGSAFAPASTVSGDILTPAGLVTNSIIFC